MRLTGQQMRQAVNVLILQFVILVLSFQNAHFLVEPIKVDAVTPAILVDMEELVEKAFELLKIEEESFGIVGFIKASRELRHFVEGQFKHLEELLRLELIPLFDVDVDPKIELLFFDQLVLVRVRDHCAVASNSSQLADFLVSEIDYAIFLDCWLHNT